MTKSLPSRLALHVGPFCFALALAGGSLACTDDDATDDAGEDSTDDDGDGDGEGEGDGDGDGDGLSHAKDMQPIWDANCVTACHEPGGGWALLDLSVDAYDNIVGVASSQAPGKKLIEPGDAEASYLVNKLRGTQVEAGGNGAAMPSGTAMLPEATIMSIEEWINAGAAP